MEKLARKNIEDIILLTPSQEGMLFHYLKDPCSGLYFEQLSLNISGLIDIDLFEKAWKVVTQANEMLRTVFRWEKMEKPSRIILKEYPCEIKFHDFSAVDESQRNVTLTEIKSNDRNKGFDLLHVPFRVILCKLAETQYEMIISNHHILYDGWSNGIILKEFFNANQELSNCRESVKLPVKTSFKEFIKWIQSRDKKKQELFWQDYLAGFETPTVLPIKKKKEKINESDDYLITLGENIQSNLDIFIKNNRVTLASIFYSAWGILLQKYCSSEDIVFGTTISGRSADVKGIEDMVGLFINTIPLRINTYPGETIIDVVSKIDHVLHEREEFEHTSLVDIQGYSSLGSSGSLFDTILVIENYPLDNNLIPGNSLLSIHSYSMVETTHYDLTVGIMPFKGIEVKFSFKQELFENDAIENLAGHFKTIIQKIIEQPETALLQLEIISIEEKNRILYEFNNTAAEYPNDRTLHQLFAEQALKSPDRIAIFGHGQTRTNTDQNNVGADLRVCPYVETLRATSLHITYSQLNNQSDRLAGLLIEKGVLPDSIVGIMMERSVEMIIGIFSILKSGGAYLPIDPDYPQERIDYMLKDSNARILINKSEIRNPKLETHPNDEKSTDQNKNIKDLMVLNFENLDFEFVSNFVLRASNFNSSNLAYVIYTSGTTGLPKGIMIEHRSVINFIKGMTDVIDFRKGDRILSLTTISFDIFGLETILPLTKGSSVIIGSVEEQQDVSLAASVMAREAVTIFQGTPSRLQLFVQIPQEKEILKKLKYLLVGGEVFPVALLVKLKQVTDASIYNVYGPTETTIWSTIKNVSDGQELNIGRPIANTQVYIIDISKKLVPVNVAGELCIGGHGLARGYLNNPELTAEKFDQDLWDKKDDQDEKNKSFFRGLRGAIFSKKAPLIYHTGDRARWLSDGNIEFLGRMDHQIKLRGFRIELAEIENRLLKHGRIKDAVVILKGDERGDKSLAAYFVSDIELSDVDLKEYLAKDLPDYMVPLFFVRLQKIPLTLSGKVDRKALPEPGIKAGENYIAPRTEIEKKLVKLWAESLARDDLHALQLQGVIGIDDNFFQLGGHSLKAMILISKIHKVFDVIVPLTEIFKTPRIKELAEYIKRKSKEFYISIEPTEKKEYYRLSSGQKRLYFLQQIDNAGTLSTVYNMTSIWILEGNLDKTYLEKVFNKLIKRHESLRTSFVVTGEEPMQRIHAEVEFEIESFATDANGVHGQTRTFLMNFIRPFDLAKAPLLRVGLLKKKGDRQEKGDRHFLLVDMHHIISDGMSTQVIVQDFSALCKAEELPEVKLHYKDFAEWQNREKINKIPEQAEYWKREYEEEIPVLELPVDYERPIVQDFDGNTINFEINNETYTNLKILTRETGATLYIVLLSLYTVLLSKLSAREDIVIGSPVAGRRHTDLDKIIGMFVNTLALRNYPSGKKKFSDFLAEVKEKTLKAFDNQEYQYEDLVEKVVLTRDISRNPLFDTMFVLQNDASQKVEMPDFKLIPYEFTNKTSKFDISLNALEKEEKLSFTFEYRTKLFKLETIERFIIYFKNIVNSVISDKQRVISDFEILTEEEKKQILGDFNNTAAEYPRDKIIHGLLAEQVERIPDHIAIVGADLRLYPARNARNLALTYNELNNQSNHLDRLLIEKGVLADTIVGIMAERSIETIIGILGILKSGGAYLPIDPEYPQERIDYMLKDSNAKILIMNKSEIRNPKLESPRGSLQHSAFDLPRTQHSNHLAYVIYTSGSTGSPRGVLVGHRSVLRLVINSNYIHFLPHDRLLLTGSMAFDISTFEIWAPLLNGAALVIPSKEIILHAEKLKKLIIQQNISILHLIPSLFNQFAAQDIRLFASLNYFLVGGDTVHPFQVNRLRKHFPRLNIIHMYGPTENTTFSTFFPFKQEFTNTIPIGKPITNSTIYILSQYHSLHPIGVSGELYVGKEGLARGYLNKPELTAEKFIYLEHIPGLIYKTGDLGRWMADGNIQFLGRVDQQVKIRGFRIELGEIENRLKQYNGITGAVVTIKEDRDGEKYLCAFIVTNTETNTQELKKYLLQYLPAYMIPAYFIPIAKIPLTPNGKVDSKGLPDPYIVGATQYMAPQDANEEKLVEIWSDVLGVEKEKIGIHDHFFDLGGSSIKMIQLNSKLEKLFNKEIPVVSLFRYTTISALAEYLNKDSTSDTGSLYIEKKVDGKNSRQEILKNCEETGIEIAVIGMAGRFSGARNIAEFWHNLQDGVESIPFYTGEELIAAGVSPALVAKPNYVRTGGGLLIEPDYFDATFFGYIPIEAEILDPQVRIYHECAWEALENAGYNPNSYDGRIGIFAGASNNPAWEASVMLSEKQRTIGEFNAMILCNKEFLCSWLSYKLNLKGPAVEVHTACSTSLVAIHMACRSLLSKECEMALAGGVYIRPLEKTGYLYQEGLILSADGQCRAFDAAATGTIGGSGAGAVVLKKLNQAIEDHDYIYAIIKGTAINNDGPRKVGFTAPSIEGQAEVIKNALHMAQVEPESIAYIETHGTGTLIGDPIEIAALTLAFNTSKKNFCAIGSVKTNIGHADSAAGVAGFIKTVLSLKHKIIPPSLNFNTPNPNIDFEQSPFFVNQVLTPLDNAPTLLRMGVSSFGIGGTNAHVILEEAPIDNSSLRKDSKYQLLLLSAKTPSALQQMTRNFCAYLKQNPDTQIDDIAFTLQVGRQAFSNRSMVVCPDVPGAAAAFSATGNGKPAVAHVQEGKKSLIFMFPGIGSQYVNMGLGLYHAYPLFQAEMNRCFFILKSILPYDIKDILFPPGDISGRDLAPALDIDHIQVSQLTIFILEYALARLIMSWGITPNAMIGYSLGEYTAACLAGVFSLEDALQIIALRGRLIGQLSRGTMLAVPMTAARLTPLLGEPLSIAIDNGPSCIISGPAALLEKFQNHLKEERFLCQKLKNSYAIHSRMMAPIAREFAEYIETIKLHPPQIPYISNVSGSWITMQEAVDPLYWARHLQQTVRFADGMELLKKEPQPIFIETGPGRDLSALCVRFQEDKPGSLAVNLIRPQMQNITDDYYLLKKIGHLWLRGVSIDWHGFHAGGRKQRIALPSYPFEREHYPIMGDPHKIINTMVSTAASQSLQKRANMAEWFYQPIWEKSFTMPSQSIANLEKMDWLVFIDQPGLGRSLITKLQQSGAHVLVVAAGESFQQLSGWEFTINPKQDSDYEHLFIALHKSQRMPYQILHLWGISKPVPEQQRFKEIDDLQDLGFFSLLAIARAIGSLGVTDTFYIAVVTDNMQDITGSETLCPLKSTVLGAVNVIPLEYKNIRCCSIDIQLPEVDHWPEKITLQILAEVSHHFPDHIVAYRGNHRWVRVIKSIPFPDYGSASSILKENGVYLVTGGLGGIGLALAEYLGRSLKANLILVGRSPFPLREEWGTYLSSHHRTDPICLKIRSFMEIEKNGGQVCVFQGDVADRARMVDIISQAKTRFKHINGIIHSAGIPDGGLIQVRSREASQKVFSSKLKGTLILEELFNDEPLDFFVMCSSLASILGPGGQVAYSAANTFLDAHALYKTAANNHRLTVSINWDTWQETGMALGVAAKINSTHQGNASEAIEELLGHGLLTVEGVDAFRRIIGRRFPQVMVSTKNFAAVAANAKKFYDNLSTSGTLEKIEAKKIQGALRPRPDISTIYQAPRNEIEQKLVYIWQNFFGFQDIGIDDDLFELGGDSLKAIAIIAGIHRDCGVQIPLTEIYKHSTIRGTAEYISRAGETIYTEIGPVEEQEYYPMSSAQKRLYILYSLDKDSTAYNMSLVLTLEQNINMETMEKTFQKVIARHESLRTSFHSLGSEFIQRIHPAVTFTINSCQLSGESLSEFIRPFDLSVPPLLRVGIGIMPNGKCLLIFDMHHIIGDGMSMEILVTDFAALYDRQELSPLKIQYKDFSEWQKNEPQNTNIKQQGEYWLQQFAGELPLLDVLSDYDRPAMQSFEGSNVNFEISNEELAQLKSLALDTDTTLYMVLLTIYNVFLYKISNQEDIVVGSPVAGRRHAGLEKIIGMFVNTLALRNYPLGNKRFINFLSEIKGNTLKALDNQDYPYEDLVENVSVTRDLSRNPLFDTMFTLQNIDNTKLNLPGIKFSLYQYKNKISKFDLTLSGIEREGSLSFTFEYCTKLFKQETIARFIVYFKNIVGSIMENKERRIADLEMMTAEEKKRILFEFNDTEVEYAKDKTIHQLFAEQSAQTPDAVALVAVDACETREKHEKQITYFELNEQSDRLARLLIKKGVLPDNIVGILMVRSVEMIVGILGILKSGGAYLPIDPQYPQERIDYMLKDSKAKILIINKFEIRNPKLETNQNDQNLNDQNKNRNLEIPLVLNFEDLNFEFVSCFDIRASNLIPSNLAYVIYTSGSSGKPKGIMIEHMAVHNFIEGMVQRIDFKPGKRILALTTISFDIFGLEVLLPLCRGLEVIIANEDHQRDIQLLKQLILKSGVEMLQATPTRMQMLIANGSEISFLKNLKEIMVGGEALPVKLNADLMQLTTAKIYNMYGPTETTIWSTVKKLVGAEWITIGNPIVNTQIYILNNYLKIQPVGIPGEMYISGDGVARGYLNRPELTHEKFDRDLWDEKNDQDKKKNEDYQKFFGGSRGAILQKSPLVYRTGDLARWLPNGTIEFLGRIDSQVKIRGYRVELGEIEDRLLNYPGIKEVVVSLREENDGDKYICAYIAANEEIGITGLREFLLKELPDYMIPSFFVQLEKIPLTPNGKIDRKALPAPAIKPSDCYTGPRDEIEAKLVGIWSEVLGRDELHKRKLYTSIGIDDNFFQRGGHSLNAMILMSKIHEVFDVIVPLTEIFKTPRIKELANYIKGKAKEFHMAIDPAEKKEYYDLSPAQERLYILQELVTDNTGYNMPYVISLGENVEKEKLKSTFKNLIERHENLRTSFIIVNEKPVQRIHCQVDFSIGFYEAADEAKATALIAGFMNPFNLKQAPLMRVNLVVVGSSRQVLFIDMHHIITDGTSQNILAKELRALLAEEVLQPQRFQYKDYSEWYNRMLRQEIITHQESYWLKEFSDEIPALDILTDYPRPPVQSFEGNAAGFSLNNEETLIIKRFAAENESTLYMFLLAVFNILLTKLSGQEDIIIGTPIAARRHSDLLNVVGMLVNTLAMRNYPAGDKPFRKFLKEVKRRTLDAYENQEYPFEVLVDKISVARDAARNPLFDVMLLFQNMQETPDEILSEEIEDLNIDSNGFEKKRSLFDLSLEIFESKGELHLRFEYCTKLFKEETILRFVNYFKRIIISVTDDPEQEISAIEILSKEELSQLLYDFNNTQTICPDDKTLYELFEEQVVRTPGSIAVVFEDQALSYSNLNEKAGQLAGYLNFKINIQPGEPVAVLMDRSINIITAILGVLEAGGAYVPIDASLPEFRIKHMIHDAGIGVVISGKRQIKILNRLQWECKNFHTFLCMDSVSVYEEDEVEKNELMDEGMWKYIGESAADEITGGGWISSYTGEPFSNEEMQEYSDNAFKKLNPLLCKSMRVLEIGCASGITMFRIAPYVDFYYGTDLSAVIIEKNKNRVKTGGYRNITLDCLAAHDIDRIKNENFDLIIINSVIQYFYGHNYLRKVIAKAIDKLAEKGYLFLGDIMDQELKKNLSRETAEFKRANSNKNYRTKTDWNAELFVARGFFKDLALRTPGIQDIEFSNKIHTIENELTKFRYDALITVDKSKLNPNQNKNQSPQKYQHDLLTLNLCSCKRGGYQKEQAVQPKGRGPAYVIYTSGTTGLPKGIMIEHRSVINFIKGMTDVIDFRKDDRVLSLTTISFDIFGLETLLSLTRGSEVVIGNHREQVDPGAMLRIIVKKAISILQLTPSRLQVLFSGEINKALFSGLKYLIIGGEAFPGMLLNEARKIMPGEIYNVYGPTETTIWSTIKNVSDGQELNIGRPIANTQVYIVDKSKKLVPVNAPGELCIGGHGLARGYLNNPELTAEKFDQDLWDEKDDQDEKNKSFSRGLRGAIFSKKAPLIYHTGDRARWLSDGNIEFLGRMDHQVKLRGFRIELAEIENRLLTHGQIKDAVVLLKEDKTGDKNLAAYFVSDIDLSDVDLKDYLAKDLPDYMIPLYFVRLGKLPLTPSGKLDRRALPEPGIKAGESYIAPRDEIEKKLVKLWAEILTGDESQVSLLQTSIGIDDNFFQLGGHSLKATILSGRIEKAFNVKIPLAEIFKNPKLNQLSGYIKSAASSKYEQVTLAEKKEYYSLSSAQKRLYFLQQMAKDGTAYSMPSIWLLEGDLDRNKLENTFHRLIQRDESLRTSFHVINDEPVQRVHDEVEFEIESFATDANGVHGQTRTFLMNFIRPFDLAKAPLLRVGLLKEKGDRQDRHILMVDMHHIISDGISMNILVKDFMALYRGEDLPELRVQYKDFSGWQKSEKQAELIRQQADFWLNEFIDEVPVLELPADYPRPLVQSFEGGSINFEIDKEMTRALKKLALETESTIYILLLAVYTAFLSKISNQKDIVVGSPIAGRRHTELEKIIGMFVNTLALRNFPSGEKKWTDFLAEVKEKTLKAFENQDYQYEDLVEKAVLTRDTGRNPLFDTMFVLQNMEIVEINIPGLKLFPYPYENKTAKFDLTLTAVEVEEKLLFNFEYCTKLFKEETIKRFIVYFKNIVTGVNENKNRKIGDYEIITEEEKKQILVNFNDTEAEYPKDKTIHGLFAEQAAQKPDYVAVFGHGQTRITRTNTNNNVGADLWVCPARNDRNVSVTYHELNDQSNRLARLLIKKGVLPDTIVAIMMERSVEMIIGIFGILKSGGAYLPIDPVYPQDRINYILKDSKAKLTINYEFLKEVPQAPLQHSIFHVFDLTRTQHSNHLCYVIYTSGSTGKPKGVMMMHRSVNNLVWGLKEKIYKQYSGILKVILLAPFVFDASVQQIFGALLQGHTLHVASEENRVDGTKLTNYFRKHKIDISDGTPTHIRILLESLQGKPAGFTIRHFIIAGEVLPPGIVKRFLEHFEANPPMISNLYGPTETCVDSTYYHIQPETLQDCNFIPIGKPLPNEQIYILDTNLKLQPLGVPGELCIAGDGLARGYVNNPELTAERFQFNRSNMSYMAYILYRTGDLARWLPGGNIEYLGRIDNQVKIRGFRIELGEIETQLLKCPGINKGVVIDRDIGEGKKSLCAYLISEKELDISELKSILSKNLPDYMIPSYFIRVDKIPLINGKIDRKTLNSIGIEQMSREKYTAPQNEIEKKIVEIWKEVLNLEKIGVSENFFDLGGTSFDIIRLNVKFNQAFNEEETAVQMFRYPTIRSFSEYLIQKRDAIICNTIDRPMLLDKMKQTRILQKTKRLKREI